MLEYDIISPLLRTTIALDDDLIPELKSYAEHRDLSVAKAVSELVRKASPHLCARVNFMDFT